MQEALFTMESQGRDFYFSSRCALEESPLSKVLYFDDDNLYDFVSVLGFSKNCISALRKNGEKYEISYFGYEQDKEPVLTLNFNIFQIGIIYNDFTIDETDDGFSVEVMGYYKRLGDKPDFQSRPMKFLLKVKKIIDK